MQSEGDISSAFEEAAGKTTDPAALEELNRMADEALALESVVEQLTDDLKAASSALAAISMKALPAAMERLGVDFFGRNGKSFKLEQFVRGSLNDAPDADAALRWIEEAGGAGMIKNIITASFGTGQDNVAKEVIAWLSERAEAMGFEFSVEKGVHSSTLCAFARERLRNGEEINPEALGLFVGKRVKIGETKAPGPKKGRKK